VRSTETQEYLIALLVRRPDDGLEERFEKSQPKDWDQLLQEAVRHGVAPFLYSRLKSPNTAVSPEVPSAILSRLKQHYLASVVRNTRLFHELGRVLSAFRQADIPVMPLKGAFLAENVYGNVGLRPMSDVDLLVRHEDLAEAQRVLGAVESSLPVDIHWDIDLSIEKVHTDIDEIWSRANDVRVAGVEVKGLSAEDLLLHLCIHVGFHHLFELAGLRSLVDIKETIGRFSDSLDWEAVESRARRWGVSNCVGLVLDLAEDFVGADVPEGVVKNLVPEGFAPGLREWAVTQVFHGSSDPYGLSPYFWKVWGKSGFREKLRAVGKLLVPDPEFVSQKYSAPVGTTKNIANYAVRFKDHASRYLKATWRMVRREQEITAVAEKQKPNKEMRGRMGGGAGGGGREKDSC